MSQICKYLENISSKLIFLSIAFYMHDFSVPPSSQICLILPFERVANGFVECVSSRLTLLKTD